MTASAPLLNKGMKAVLVSQFITAFADNAILFAILAQLSARHYPEWSQPMLQMVFVLTFIVLAPFDCRQLPERAGDAAVERL